MTQISPLDLPPQGKLVQNITHFARALRKAGLPLGTGRLADAIRAVQIAGFTERDDFYWTLHACFVSRPEHRLLFDQMFRLYWRDPKFLDHMMALITPMMRGLQDDRRANPAEKRAAEALLDGVDRPVPDLPQDQDAIIEIDASQTMSETERLRILDFEQMSTADMAAARRMLARLRLPIKPLISRRTEHLPGPLPDWRGTMRRSLRHGGQISALVTRRHRTRMPNLVVLCDISGSMAQYSRAVLQFVHAVANAHGQGWAQVHAFTFGTRLTNITRHLSTRDVDAALAAAGSHAQDWSGGTRIGACLTDFNRDWSRRVLGQGAIVLLITDGLDRDPAAGLGPAMERLALSARSVIWLNPLLRWDGFAPRAKGIALMLPHVTSFRAGHNIAALEALGDAISRPDDAGQKARLMRLLADGAPSVP
jgi:uncharacterized protein